MGKSSLLTKLHNTPPNDWTPCFIDFQSLNTTNLNCFYKEFFEEVKSQFGKKTDSWKKIALFASTRKIIFLFDDIGKIKKSHFHHIMGSIFSLVQKRTNITIVSASPKSISEIFWANNTQHKHYNNKYCKNWYPIIIKPLTDTQIDHLTNLLPQKVKDICNDQMNLIKVNSNAYPQKLQALFYRLVDEFNNNGVENIESLINKKLSYE